MGKKIGIPMYSLHGHRGNEEEDLKSIVLSPRKGRNGEKVENALCLPLENRGNGGQDGESIVFSLGQRENGSEAGESVILFSWAVEEWGSRYGMHCGFFLKTEK